jgi:hypothetical protein
MLRLRMHGTTHYSPHTAAWHGAYSSTRETFAFIPYSTALPEKLTVTKQVKKFPTFYGTQSFIAMFTRAHHWSLS